MCPICGFVDCACTEQNLEEIIVGLNDNTTDKDRPFTGQPHTVQGERGKTEIIGIRFRDLADCVCKAFIDVAVLDLKDKTLQEELQQRAEDGTLNYNDLYKLDLSKMDPVALIQNISCRVEKEMGIYPNVQRLESDD